MRFHAYWEKKNVTENEVFKKMKLDVASSAVSPFEILISS